ncbi:MAG: hypothetical protein N2234_04290, partial [Planctomycetota bacterium]|nr:hypothetical protein [Planctomycetota bacterium]
SCYVAPEGGIIYLEVNGEKKQVEGTLSVKVHTSNIRTLYLVAGDFIAYICVFLWGTGLVFAFLRKKQGVSPLMCKN